MNVKCSQCNGTGIAEDPRQREAFERSGFNPELAPETDECPECFGDGWVSDPPHGYEDERRCSCNPAPPVADLGDLDEEDRAARAA